MKKLLTVQFLVPTENRGEGAQGPVANRRITYRLYPTGRQEAALEGHLKLHAELYNAALQERRDAWRIARISVTKRMQEKQLPELKKLRSELISLGGHALQETLRRVDLAFKAFFRRCKARNGKAGFPRFKSWRRFGGWTYKSASNWAFIPGERGRHGVIRMEGVGDVKMRGKARQLGEVKTCTIVHRAGRWYASIVADVTPGRRAGTEALGFDWGVSSFLTMSDGSNVPNPRHLEHAKTKLVTAQRKLSRKKRGSRNRKKAAAAVARLHERVANRRANFHHQTSAALVAHAGLLATEKLKTKNMTRSARGTVEAPGKNVRQKAGLNRSILDGAPAAFLAMVRYKAKKPVSHCTRLTRGLRDRHRPAPPAAPSRRRGSRSGGTVAPAGAFSRGTRRRRRSA